MVVLTLGVVGHLDANGADVADGEVANVEVDEGASAHTLMANKQLVGRSSWMLQPLKAATAQALLEEVLVAELIDLSLRKAQPSNFRLGPSRELKQECWSMTLR